MAACAALLAAACGSSSPSGTSSSPTTSSVPKISASSFNLSFSAMKEIKSLAAKGKGNVAAILPDTVSSTRYVEFDAPYLKKSMELAGLKPSQIVVQNALGSDATEYSDAEADITKGASVLIMDPLDSGVGARIESYAKSHGVPVIDYDRLTLGGSRKYYVSFNNVEVGTLLGKGLVSCISSWHVAKPQVMVMRGAPTDNNATLFAQGYLAVLNPLFSNKTYTDVANPAGTWDPPTALTEFEAAYTAHPGINAVLMPNDENGAPIIHYLQTKGIAAGTFPVTGQDATLTGLQNVIAGYQCGTVYKPIYLEAQAAVALAMYLRAGDTPPSSLVNGQAEDVTSKVEVPSILETPEWVTPSTVNSTVIKDGFVPASQLCAAPYTADCTKYGISG
ncbi:MAG TPA: substrate-binding domain-containing protein [Streptosporangiaceae bacterium]|nr:substrate-binding domain-containing protein [Streptosporangiaceae bacterium]